MDGWMDRCLAYCMWYETQQRWLGMSVGGDNKQFTRGRYAFGVRCFSGSAVLQVACGKITKEGE